MTIICIASMTVNVSARIYIGLNAARKGNAVRMIPDGVSIDLLGGMVLTATICSVVSRSI